jgi:hypothetical protein
VVTVAVKQVVTAQLLLERQQMAQAVVAVVAVKVVHSAVVAVEAE